MWVTRAIVSCVLLLSTGGCSQLFREPTQYASLPQAEGVSMRRVEAPDSGGADGEASRHMQRSRSGSGVGVDPHTALERSIHARTTWKRLEPTDLTKPPAIVSARGRLPTLAGSPDPTATNSLPSAQKPSTAAHTNSDNYDREATMNRLVKGGEEAAKPICKGC